MSEIQAYIDSISDENRQKDCGTLLKMMQEISQENPKIWSNSMVGFGTYHYKYESGREGDWFLTGFSSRKQKLTIYIVAGFAEYEHLLAKLGKFKIGVSCLYINSLADIDLFVLSEMISHSIVFLRTKYKTK